MHRLIRKVRADPLSVMPALVAGIHVVAARNQDPLGFATTPSWMAGTSPAMTNGQIKRNFRLRHCTKLAFSTAPWRRQWGTSVLLEWINCASRFHDVGGAAANGQADQIGEKTEIRP